MTKYEFSLQQEILLEKGSSVLGDLFRYRLRQNAPSNDPISIMYNLVWAEKQHILTAKSNEELSLIEDRFNFAAQFLSNVEAISNEQ